MKSFGEDINENNELPDITKLPESLMKPRLTKAEKRELKRKSKPRKIKRSSLVDYLRKEMEALDSEWFHYYSDYWDAQQEPDYDEDEDENYTVMRYIEAKVDAYFDMINYFELGYKGFVPCIPNINAYSGEEYSPTEEIYTDEDATDEIRRSIKA